MFERIQSGRRRDEAAHALYVAVVAQARRPEFYRQGGVADSLDGRFDMVVLHAFLVLRRLGAVGASAKPLSQAVFDLMFADMDANLRELGAPDVGIGRRVKAMAKAFYGRVAAYDEAIGDADRLSQALLRNLYRGRAVSAETLAGVVRYVQAQASLLDQQEAAELLSGRVRFGEPELP